jgi:hypothetical protein
MSHLHGRADVPGIEDIDLIPDLMLMSSEITIGGERSLRRVSIILCIQVPKYREWLQWVSGNQEWDLLLNIKRRISLINRVMLTAVVAIIVTIVGTTKNSLTNMEAAEKTIIMTTDTVTDIIEIGTITEETKGIDHLLKVITILIGNKRKVVTEPKKSVRNH